VTTYDPENKFLDKAKILLDIFKKRGVRATTDEEKDAIFKYFSMVYTLSKT